MDHVPQQEYYIYMVNQHFKHCAECHKQHGLKKMIGIFLGLQDSGKTLSMVYFGYKYYRLGYEIYSNFGLNFPHKKITKDLLINYTKSRIQFNRSVFLIDEIYLLLESRRFGKDSNIMIGYFLLQSSKNNVHIMATSQYIGQVEKRFRENRTFSCFCERVVKTESGYFVPIKIKRRFLPENLNDRLYIKNTFLIRDSYDIVDVNLSRKQYFLRAKPIFNLFSTQELLPIE